MQMRLSLAAVAAFLVVLSGCDALTDLGGGEELLGLTCSDGTDTTLVGLWRADTYDWGEGDMIARGWELEVELWEDGDGRLVETRPVESSDSTQSTGPDPVAARKAPVAASTHAVADSAHFSWLACDGQLAVVIGATYYSSEDGEFTDSRFDYSFDGTTLSLSDSETGTHITLRGGGVPSAMILDPALFGTWTAVSITASDLAGQFDPVELTAEGWALEVTLNDDGTYSLTYVEAGGEPVTETGEYMADEDQGVMSFDHGPNLYYEISGGQVTVTDSEGEASYDFDDDGTDEDAVFVYVLEPKA
jgi:hypothetical protein